MPDAKGPYAAAYEHATNILGFHDEAAHQYALAQPNGDLAWMDKSDLPRLEDATDEDIRLAASACGERSMYGGFLRCALSAIYTERARAESQAKGRFREVPDA